MTERVQIINNKASIDIMEMVEVKERHSEERLLKRRAYFEAMIEKGTAGLAEVNGLLTKIHAAKQ